MSPSWIKRSERSGISGATDGRIRLSYLAFYGAFPEQVDKVAVVSGTNMVNTSFETKLTLSVPNTVPGIEVESARLAITPSATDSVVELKYSIYCDGGVANSGFRITRNINGTDVLVVPASNKWEGFISAIHGDEDNYDSVPSTINILNSLKIRLKNI